MNASETISGVRTAWLCAPLFLAPLLLAGCATSAKAGDGLPPPEPLRVSDISLHLFRTDSGTLSDDLGNEFSGWNTIIGEGAAGGPAEDMLVSVHLKSDGHYFIADRPLTITVSGEEGVLASRTVDNFLTSESGDSAVPLWVPEIGCAGPITIAATLDGLTVSETANFACGE